MLFPLNVGSSIVCGSAKSCAQPTDGHTFTSDSETLQNRVNIVSRVTRPQLGLEAHLLQLLVGDLRDRALGLGVVGHDQQVLAALVLARAKPAFLKYSADRLRSPSGFCIQSNSGSASAPPLSSKPAMPGGM